jgi:DNA-binding MltR family transcriptional regulator
MVSRNRGVRKPKLRDYSQKPLTPEEKTALLAAIKAQQFPIPTAILGAVMVEHEMELLLRRRLKRNDDDTWEELLNESGPLRSFYSKIILGYAMGLYDEKIQHDLNIIRTIRNAFAHSKKILTFDDKLIIGEILRAHNVRKRDKKWLQKSPTPDSARTFYITICYSVAIKLMQLRGRATAAKNRRLKNKFAKSPIVNALFAGFGPAGLYGLQSGLQSGPPIPRADQIGGPNPEAPIGLLGLLLSKPPKPDDNKGS